MRTARAKIIAVIGAVSALALAVIAMAAAAPPAIFYHA